MTVNRDPDGVLADWLAEGPSELPSETRQAIVSGIATKRQSRWGVAWRGWSVDMRRWSVAAGMAALAITFAAVMLPGFLSHSGVGGVASPQPSATPVPTPTAQVFATFVSLRHGYSVQYPADWTTVAATAPWPAAGDPFVSPVDFAAYDEFTPPLGAEYSQISITSERLPAGTTASHWPAAYVAALPQTFQTLCIPPADQWQSIKVNGVDMTTYVDKCNSASAMAVTGGRAYLLGISGYTSASLTVFDQMLRAITFLPGDGDDSPAPSPSPTHSAGSPSP